MDDTMRFEPDKVEVQAGEVIRFVVHNTGAVPHEFVLGNEPDIATHAALMRLDCLIPGHFEAGMRGTVLVKPVAAAAGKSPASSPADMDHPHDHKH